MWDTETLIYIVDAPAGSSAMTDREKWSYTKYIRKSCFEQEPFSMEVKNKRSVVYIMERENGHFRPAAAAGCVKTA